MKSEINELNRRLGIFLALALPFITCLIQWLVWPFINPYVWFLFFPAVFVSAWIGRMVDGIAAAVLSSLLVWYFFIPPQMSFSMKNSSNSYSIGVFMLMGVLFSLTHDRLRKANLRAVEALASARAINDQLKDANGKINTLYSRTLELDKLKTQFFSNVSHELRTPLALILGPLKKTIAEPDLSDTARCSLELIQRNAQLLHHHVSDLLDIAKMEAGKMEVRYSHLDLARLVRGIASHFEGVAADRALRYTVSTPEAIAAQTDGEKLQRILLNLLSNAFKFVPDGGYVHLTMAAQNNQAVVRVMDSGPGVPAEMRGSVFERFFQVDGYASRSYGGTGLGLSIVKEFAELLGGNIVCGEAPEKGALFTLTIPLIAPPGSAIEGEFSQLEDGAGNGKPYESRQKQAACSLSSPVAEVGRSDLPLILVVEDNPDMNAYAANILRPSCRVASAFNGEEGLEMAMKTQPDMIISDVMMPNMSGEQMVIELRKRLELADVPIVMLTAKADDALRLKMLQLGVQEYLSKPFSDDELMARVDRLLSDRIRSVEQLRASEAKFRALFENMLNLMVHCRMIFEEGIPVDFEYIDVNPAFEEITGLKGAKGRRLSEVLPGYCRDNPESLEIFGQVALTGESRHWEHFVADLGIWFRFAIYSPGKGEVAIIGEDISERKLAEEEVLRLNAELEQRVEERTRELLAANRELDAFAYAVSHDLRAPLRAMSGFSQALIEDYGDRLEGEARVFLDQIMIGSRRMGELIDGLLTLSRTTRGELQRNEVDLSAMAERLLYELSSREPERRVHWTVMPGLSVLGDETMLEVVMSNLLSNAWKYTSNKDEADIRFYAEEKKTQRHFVVVDNGAGFEAAHAAKLFQPFQRLHRQEEFPGIGIGLATAQRIIHRHGGMIWAEGARDRGATFSFSIPNVQ